MLPAVIMSEWEDCVFVIRPLQQPLLKPFHGCGVLSGELETEKKKKHSTSTQSKTCPMQASTSPHGILQIKMENRFIRFGTNQIKYAISTNLWWKPYFISWVKVHVLWWKLICATVLWQVNLANHHSPFRSHDLTTVARASVARRTEMKGSDFVILNIVLTKQERLLLDWHSNTKKKSLTRWVRWIV